MNQTKKVPILISTQLGYLTSELNLYGFMDRTGLGKSMVGREMDLIGRHLLNHRMGGGHLWWKELANRPQNQWGDVLEHLVSDFPTKQGLPYAFDSTHIRDPRVVEALGLKKLSSSSNWGMLNAFEFASGLASIALAIYEFKGSHTPFTSDMALAGDFSFLALNVGSGIATCNPLLIAAAVFKAGTILSKLTASSFHDIDVHPGPFDVSLCEYLDSSDHTTSDLDDLLGIRGLQVAW